MKHDLALECARCGHDMVLHPLTQSFPDLFYLCPACGGNAPLASEVYVPTVPQESTALKNIRLYEILNCDSAPDGLDVMVRIGKETPRPRVGSRIYSLTAEGRIGPSTTVTALEEIPETALHLHLRGLSPEDVSVGHWLTCTPAGTPDRFGLEEIMHIPTESRSTELNPDFSEYGQGLMWAHFETDFGVRHTTGKFPESSDRDTNRFFFSTLLISSMLHRCFAADSTGAIWILDANDLVPLGVFFPAPGFSITSLTASADLLCISTSDGITRVFRMR